MKGYENSTTVPSKWYHVGDLMKLMRVRKEKKNKKRNKVETKDEEVKETQWLKLTPEYSFNEKHQLHSVIAFFASILFWVTNIQWEKYLMVWKQLWVKEKQLNYRLKLSLVTRKPVFEVSYQVRLKPAWSASESS